MYITHEYFFLTLSMTVSLSVNVGLYLPNAKSVDETVIRFGFAYIHKKLTEVSKLLGKQVTSFMKIFTSVLLQVLLFLSIDFALGRYMR